MRSEIDAPRPTLGSTHPDGVAPAVLGLVDRGILLRPGAAVGMRGLIVLRFAEHPAVTISFGATEIVVSDGEAGAPDVVVAGRMADVTRLLATPGLLSSLGAMASGRVRIKGRRLLARRFVTLLAVDD